MNKESTEQDFLWIWDYDFENYSIETDVKTAKGLLRITTDKQYNAITSILDKYGDDTIPDKYKWVLDYDIHDYDKMYELEIKTDNEGNLFSIFEDVIIYWDEDEDRRVQWYINYMNKHFPNYPLYSVYEHKASLTVVFKHKIPPQIRYGSTVRIFGYDEWSYEEVSILNN